MRLFMIRHGQTVANLEHFYAGQSDVKLTDLGREQAKRLEPVLRELTFDRVFSSDLSRAVDTQRLALPGYTAEQTPLLREYDTGTLTGVDYIAYRQVHGPVKDHSRHGGESKAMVLRRVQRFLDELTADPCEQAVAFTHNGVMNAMLSLVLGEDCDTAAVTNDNCNVAVFSWNGKKWSLLAWNYAGWL